MRVRCGCGVLAPLVVALLAAAAAGDVIELVSGDVLHGTVVEQTGDLVVIEHETLGRIELPADEVASVKTDAELVAEAAQVEAGDVAQPLEEAQAAAADAEEEESPWSLAVDFSLTSTSGNTEETAKFTQRIRVVLYPQVEHSIPRWLTRVSTHYEESRRLSATDVAARFLRPFECHQQAFGQIAAGRFVGTCHGGPQILVSHEVGLH